MKATVKKTVVAWSQNVTRAVPLDWGRSELTRFIGAAEDQAYATYAALPDWVRALEGIDQNLTENAPTFFHEIDPPRRTAAKLFMRAFGKTSCRTTRTAYGTRPAHKGRSTTTICATSCCSALRTLQD